MSPEDRQLVFNVIANIEEGGYSNQIDFDVFRKLLSQNNSHLARWIHETKQRRPAMDWVNLISTIAGALNYETVRHHQANDAIALLRDSDRLDEFIRDHYETLRKISYTRSNNPTVPQRAIPLACCLPKTAKSLGVIELGCSRGDIGLVLTNIDEVLAHSDQLFMPTWSDNARQKAKGARCTDGYLGIDIQLLSDDEWLLALWGLGDPRRDSLRNFYSRYSPHAPGNVALIEADVCCYDSYRAAVLDFAAPYDSLVIVTSFMIYQLSVQQRHELARAVHAIGKDFVSALGCEADVCWLNQGMPIHPGFRGSLDFHDLQVCRLGFDENRLFVRETSRLTNDLCDDWFPVEKRDVLISSLPGI